MATNQRDRARKATQAAIRYGKLQRPDTCSRCDVAGDIHAHHRDYDRPLDVEWLCPDCHRAAHGHPKRERKPGRPKRPPPTTSLDELKQAEADYRENAWQADLMRGRRNTLIAAALADGHTQRDIAKALGLSAGRVGQLATERKA